MTTLLPIALLIVLIVLLVRSSSSERYGPGGTCVCMFSTTNIATGYAGLAARINERYARRHGYAFVHRVVAPLPDRWSTMWARVAMLCDLVTRYDAVVYIDSDAIFNLQDRTLDFLLDGPWDFAGCADHPNGRDAINGGVLFLRNTPWTREFVSAWYARRHAYTEFSYEQKALSDMVRSLPPDSSNVRIFPADAFNSIAADIAAGKRDTFVLHFMSMDDDTRVRELRRWLNAHR